MAKGPSDIQGQADVRKLVDSFYERVRNDPMLAPVFSHIDWPAHLPVMYAFWSSLLLGDNTYQGNPFQKHMNLPVGPAHFDRWLELFTLAAEQFEGPKASEAIERARSIAGLFRHRLGIDKRG